MQVVPSLSKINDSISLFLVLTSPVKTLTADDLVEQVMRGSKLKSGLSYDYKTNLYDNPYIYMHNYIFCVAMNIFILAITHKK